MSWRENSRKGSTATIALNKLRNPRPSFLDRKTTKIKVVPPIIISEDAVEKSIRNASFLIQLSGKSWIIDKKSIAKLLLTRNA